MAIQIFKLFHVLRVDSDHNFCESFSGFSGTDPKKFKSLGNVSNSKSKVSDFLKLHKNDFYSVSDKNLIRLCIGNGDPRFRKILQEFPVT